MRAAWILKERATRGCIIDAEGGEKGPIVHPTVKIGLALIATAILAFPLASASSTSQHSGATATFSQTIDFPTDNLFAALALRNSGFGFGFGSFGGIDSIANVQRSGNFNVFSDHTFGIDQGDALNLAALGGCRFGGCFDTFGFGNSFDPFGSSFGNSFGSSFFSRCLQDRVFGSSFSTIC